jgi:hypothetical protein
MVDLGSVIRTKRDEIVSRWTAQAQKVAAVRGLEDAAFQNIMPLFVGALADAGDDLGRYSGERREYLEGHVATRIIQGFGLAEIVDEKAHGGRVHVESTAEAGTTFTLVLPRNARPPPPAERPADESPSHPPA